jgi:hypothetical protein
MHEKTCPRCGASRVVQRMVNNRFRASDPAGQVFEVTLQEPIWSCPACQMSWEGEGHFRRERKRLPGRAHDARSEDWQVAHVWPEEATQRGIYWVVAVCHRLQEKPPFGLRFRREKATRLRG